MGFFGLQPKNKLDIHEQIFQLIYYGEGGFTHSDIYDMPVYLRSFYYKKLVEVKKKEEKQVQESQRKNKAPRTPNIPRFKR